MVRRRRALAIIGGCLGIGGIGGAVAHEHDPLAHDPDPDGPVITDLSHDPADGPVIPASEVTVTASVHDPEGQLEEVVFAETRNFTRVETVPVSGESDTATYTYDEAPRHLRSGYDCLAWVKSADGRVGEQVTGEGPEISVPVRAQFQSVNDPVPAGERLEATVSVEHIGSIQDAGPVPDVHLVVGGEIVDSQSLDLGYSEETTLTLGYETYRVEQDVSFDVQVVAGNTVADVRTVDVHA